MSDKLPPVFLFEPLIDEKLPQLPSHSSHAPDFLRIRETVASSSVSTGPAPQFISPSTIGGELNVPPPAYIDQLIVLHRQQYLRQEQLVAGNANNQPSLSNGTADTPPVSEESYAMKAKKLAESKGTQPGKIKWITDTNPAPRPAAMASISEATNQPQQTVQRPQLQRYGYGFTVNGMEGTPAQKRGPEIQPRLIGRTIADQRVCEVQELAVKIKALDPSCKITTICISWLQVLHEQQLPLTISCFSIILMSPTRSCWTFGESLAPLLSNELPPFQYVDNQPERDGSYHQKVQKALIQREEGLLRVEKYLEQLLVVAGEKEPLRLPDCLKMAIAQAAALPLRGTEHSVPFRVLPSVPGLPLLAVLYAWHQDSCFIRLAEIASSNGEVVFQEVLFEPFLIKYT